MIGELKSIAISISENGFIVGAIQQQKLNSMRGPLIKIMADYQTFPIWKTGYQVVENVDPDELPISKELKSSIKEWQKKYDATLNMSDPISSGFKTEAEENNFEKQGVKIWTKMIEEIGDIYQIKYFSWKYEALFDLPSDMPIDE